MTTENYMQNPDKKENPAIDDNAYKYTLSALTSEFLAHYNVKSYLLITDWIETGDDSEKKVARKIFGDGSVELLLIEKKTINGERKTIKNSISAAVYDEYVIASIVHVEKTRHEFVYTQGDNTFDMKYDEFTDSSLRVLEVDAENDEARETFVASNFEGADLQEVTGDERYYGYRVAQMI